MFSFAVACALNRVRVFSHAGDGGGVQADKTPKINTFHFQRDEQNSWKELPPNKANGNQKSLGHLKGAKTTAR